MSEGQSISIDALSEQELSECKHDIAVILARWREDYQFGYETIGSLMIECDKAELRKRLQIRIVLFELEYQDPVLFRSIVTSLAQSFFAFGLRGSK